MCVFAGEMAELRADLQSDKKERKKEAIKKIIANMTVGKDVRCESHDTHVILHQIYHHFSSLS